MPDLSRKENYLRAMRHEPYEYVPCSVGQDVGLCGMLVPVDRGDATTNFVDGFGVRWVASNSAAGGLIPAPGEFLLKDIGQWKKTVKIPDVDDYDWEKFAETEKGLGLFDFDGKGMVRGCFSSNGIWERLAALMGFEEAMIAMYEDPDAVDGFFGAVTEFKIRLAEKIKKYFNADTFTNFDDFATERELFISPELYRKLIKPWHTKLNRAVENLGMIPIQHTCGKADLCIEDYIETGAHGWNTVQPTNDIKGMLDKYGDKFCLEGGFDMNGKPGRPDASLDEVRAEVERCFREYGGKKGFIFSGMVVTTVDNPNAQAISAAISETADKCRFAGK